MHKSTTLFKSIIFFVLLFPVAAELCGDESYFILAQETKIPKIDTIQTSSINLPNAPQVEQGDVDFTDGTNSLIRITDEGTFGAIEIKTGVPSTTTDKLYNDGGTLKFNGSSLGGGSGATSINDLTDAKSDGNTLGASLFLGSGAGVNDDGGISDGSKNRNTAIGYNALNSNTTGSQNTANGNLALNSNTTGHSNTANGKGALNSNTTGSENTANGTDALFFNSTGHSNIANGYQALYSNTTGYSNTANGYTALVLNTEGYYNTATGKAALFNNTTGDENTANGYQALALNTTGDNNTAVGSNSLYSNTTGDENTATGYYSLYSNTTGTWNVANGYYALYSNTTGNNNTSMGKSALYSNTTGANNTAVGSLANNNNATNNNNTAIGSEALRFNDSGNNNTAVGSKALYQGHGNDNVAVGFNSLYSTIGNSNIGIGRNALYTNNQGSTNIAVGQGAMYNNTTGNNNIGIGFQTNVNNTTGSDNTVIGHQAGGGATNTRERSVFIGYKAGFNELASDKLYIANSSTTTPLIWGDFLQAKVGINGLLGVGTMSPNARLDINSASGENPLAASVNNQLKFQVFANGGTAVGTNVQPPQNGLKVSGNIIADDIISADGGIQVGAVISTLTKIVKVTGTTDANSNTTAIPLPAGFNWVNTHVMALKVRKKAVPFGLGQRWTLMHKGITVYSHIPFELEVPNSDYRDEPYEIVFLLID